MKQNKLINQKGVLGEGGVRLMVIIVLVLLMAAVVGWWAITSTSESGTRLTELGEGERGFEGMYGMCSQVQCEATGGDSVVSSMLKTCPSTRVRLAFQLQGIQKQEVNKYKYCCIVDHCSDITDHGVPRVQGCFYGEEDQDYSLCATDKGHKTGYTEDLCLGYAKDCLPEDGCCCVIPESKNALRKNK